MFTNQRNTHIKYKKVCFGQASHIAAWKRLIRRLSLLLKTQARCAMLHEDHIL